MPMVSVGATRQPIEFADATGYELRIEVVGADKAVRSVLFGGTDWHDDTA